MFRLALRAPAQGSRPPSTLDVDGSQLLPTFDAEPEAAKQTLTVDIGAATTPGRARERNEDAYLVRRQSWCRAGQQHELALLAVADGMGGYDGGEQASAVVIQALQTALTPLFDRSLSGQQLAAGEFDRLHVGFNDASLAVYRAAQSEPRWKGMGAAAVAALLWRDQVHLAHVGDCRAYHFHDDQLRQVTKDQTLVQRMIDLGTLKAHEAQHHPAKNELSQALGRRPDVVPETCQLTLAAGDWLLLACDGLHADLGHDALCREFERAAASATLFAQRLIDVVDQRGGSDNCTVIAVHGF